METFRNVAFCFGCWQHLSMDKKMAQKQAKRIAADLEGPLGRIPVERVFSGHMDFFKGLRDIGASWPQIAALLNDAGVTRKDGSPLAASQLRATLSRIIASETSAQQSSQADTIVPPRPPLRTLIKINNVSDDQNKKYSLARNTVSIREQMQRALKVRKADKL